MSEQDVERAPQPSMPLSGIEPAQEPPVYIDAAPENRAPDASWVYAIGRVEPRFPSLAVEKEFAQATGRVGTAGLTDREALRTVLADRNNRYLARQLCWVLTIEGVETYLLFARDSADLDLLLDALRTVPRSTDLDVVIGERGPLAAPDVCNGLVVPVVVFDQLYSFDVDSLLGALPRPKGVKEDQFRATAEELFVRLQQLADNAGATDEHRALNYLSVRYPAIYTRAMEAHEEGASITNVDVRPSRLNGIRTIVDVVFSFTNRQTDVVDKAFVRVDVTEEFPFLVSKLAPYFDR